MVGSTAAGLPSPVSKHINLRARERLQREMRWRRPLVLPEESDWAVMEQSTATDAWRKHCRYLLSNNKYNMKYSVTKWGEKKTKQKKKEKYRIQSFYLRNSTKAFQFCSNNRSRIADL